MATKTAKRTAGTATKPAAAEVKGDSEAATGESDGNAMLDPDGLIPDGRRVRLGVGVDEADAVLVDESDGIELEIAGELSKNGVNTFGLALIESERMAALTAPLPELSGTSSSVKRPFEKKARLTSLGDNDTPDALLNALSRASMNASILAVEFRGVEGEETTLFNAVEKSSTVMISKSEAPKGGGEGVAEGVGELEGVGGGEATTMLPSQLRTRMSSGRFGGTKHISEEGGQVRV